MIGAGAGIFERQLGIGHRLGPPRGGRQVPGAYNLATAGSGAVGRLAGPLIDGSNALRPGAYLGHPALFVLASLSVVVGTLLVLQIREPTQP